MATLLHVPSNELENSAKILNIPLFIFSVIESKYYIYHESNNEYPSPDELDSLRYDFMENTECNKIINNILFD